MLDIGAERPIEFSSSVTATSVGMSDACFSAVIAVQPDRDRARMRIESFGLPERDCRRPERASWSGPHFRIEVRLTKSSTPSPEEKRAERAVGSTWFEPPT